LSGEGEGKEMMQIIVEGGSLDGSPFQNEPQWSTAGAYNEYVFQKSYKKNPWNGEKEKWSASLCP
jgi:hypothetical protein